MFIGFPSLSTSRMPYQKFFVQAIGYLLSRLDPLSITMVVSHLWLFGIIILGRCSSLSLVQDTWLWNLVYLSLFFFKFLIYSSFIIYLIPSVVSTPSFLPSPRQPPTASPLPRSITPSFPSEKGRPPRDINQLWHIKL